MIRGEHVMLCMSYASLIIGEMLPEIHTIEMYDFLKHRINSQII